MANIPTMHAHTTEDFVVDFLSKNSDALKVSAESQTVGSICAAGALISDVLMNGGLVVAAGNGGSMADAMHLAEELAGKYRKPRRPLRAVALSDPTYLTCVGNDFGFDDIFARSCEALVTSSDAVVLFSTSGRSENVVRAAKAARRKGGIVVSLTGKKDTPLHGLSSVTIDPGKDQPTEIAQMLHTVWLHLIIEIVESRLEDQ